MNVFVFFSSRREDVVKGDTMCYSSGESNDVTSQHVGEEKKNTRNLE